jgi:TonB-dependent receptor
MKTGYFKKEEGKLVNPFKFGNKFFLMLLLSLFVFSGLLVAQGVGSLRGSVYDSSTNEKLGFANLIIKGTNLGAAANIDGDYYIRSIPVGKQSLEVSYIGYTSKTIEVTIVEDRSLIIDVELDFKIIEGEVVVITGQVEGQIQAINQQLQSNTIANVVSKSRIQELPDVNAAESVGRLPGVSIQRSGGEANKVEVRGLNPKYSLITVNGVELPSTGTDDRSVDLSLVSSNMLDGIALKKTVTADMDADVIGGTIDLRLKEAPKDFKLNVSGQVGYNELQNYYGNYKFSISVSNRFLENQLGVIASMNIDSYDRSADKYQGTWNQLTVTQIVPGQVFLREEQVKKKRIGASLLLDYLLPNGKISANGFFNKLNSEELHNINQIYTPSARYSTNRHYYELEQNERNTEIYTSAIGIDQDFEWFKYDASISVSGTDLDDPDRRVWQFAQEAEAMGEDYFPTMTPQEIAASAYVDSNKSFMAYMYRYGTRLIENKKSAVLNFTIPFNFSNQINGYFKMGGKMKWISRTNDQSQYGQGGLQYGGSGETLNNTFGYLDNLHPEWGIDDIVSEWGGLSVGPFIGDHSRSNFLGNEYPLGITIDQYRMNQMMDALSSSPDSLRLWLPYSIGNFGSDYKGFERYQAYYLMAEFNLTNYITIIPGVRWEGDYSSYDGQRYKQVQSGQAPEQEPAEFVRLNKQRRNEFWLPSVILIGKPTDWLQIKLSRTETLARPDFIQYAPISNITADGNTIEAANYSLKPAKATNYDVAFSIFNNEIGLFSVSGFYKNIEDLIFYSSFKILKGIEPDPNLEIPQSWYSSGGPQVNSNRNNPNPAEYYGFEAEWQTNFWYLPSVLQGLVLNINYTYIESETNLAYDSLQTVISGFPPRTSFSFVPREVTTRMPDQPTHILNVTVGYDIGGFSTRLSYLYQTDKLTGIGYEGTNPATKYSTYSGDYGRWDLTIQQKFYDEKLKVFANFNNLNSRPDRTFSGSEFNRPSYTEYYGLTIDLGVRYNL